jgi:hypothetical protein
MRNVNVEVSHRLLGVKDLGIPLERPREKSYKTSVGLSVVAAAAMLAAAALALKW